MKAGSYRAGQGRAPGHKRQLRDVVASLLTHTVRMAQQLGPLLLRSCQISSFSLCEPRARRGVFTPDKGAYCFWKSSSRGYEAWRQGDTSVGCSGCPQLQACPCFLLLSFQLSALHTAGPAPDAEAIALHRPFNELQQRLFQGPVLKTNASLCITPGGSISLTEL